MALPFQNLVSCSIPTGSTDKALLFAARGPQILVCSNTGVASIWSNEHTVRDKNGVEDSEEPPEKRLKLSTPHGLKSNFSRLIVSPSGKHLIGITDEDKCIRVFKINPDGHLDQISERCMSRRPCSITLTDDESTILCADKFGDVYSLPLISLSDDEENESSSNLIDEQKTFTPSASVLTVHSARNRKTLEEQLKQSAKGPAKPKESMRFKHELLLGHVSMLTDIVHATSGSRSYIITSDRDEHIRISRAQPQAHIIEGFCFGHKEFVSKLCLVEPGALVSGGGDSDLFVWEWIAGTIIRTIPIRTAALRHLQSRAELAAEIDESSFNVAVSGLWKIPGEQNMVLVALEGIPALFVYDTAKENSHHSVTIALKGNPLDLAFVSSSSGPRAVAVAIDNIHKPGSTTELRQTTDAVRLQFFSTKSGQWEEDLSTAKQFQWLNQETTGSEESDQSSPSGKALRDILYGIESLRKRPGAEA